MNKQLSKMTFALLTFCQPLLAEEIVIRATTGENIILDVSAEESFAEVMHRIHHYADQHQEIALAYADENTNSEGYLIMLADLWKKKDKGGGNKGPVTQPREYNVPVTPEEKEHITYIVTTLAQTSLTSLPGKRGDLKDRGAKVAHLHPLRFLGTIMEDEQLKGNFRAALDRTLVKGEFRGNLTDSLAQEYRANNMKSEYVADFASALSLNYNQLWSAVQNKKWNDFLEVLVKSIGKNGDRWE